MTRTCHRVTRHPPPVPHCSHFTRQRLVHFPLVKEPFFRLEHAGKQNADQPSVGPIYAEDSNSARRQAEVEKAGLHAEPRRVRQQPDGERILKGLFKLPLSQRTIQLKGRIVPIELHNELIVNSTPMQCVYIVFTHKRLSCQCFFTGETKKFTGMAVGHYLPGPPPSPPPLRLVIIAISGRNMAITMLPTMTARKTIIIGSNSEVMDATALSTSSS